MSAEITPFPESRLSRSIGISGQLADALRDSASPPSADTAVVPSAVQRVAGDPPPVPAALAPLHELEPSLMALVDSEDLVTEEQEQGFLQDLSQTLQATVAKRDRVAAFIKHCESQEAAIDAEIERLNLRKKGFASAARRVRNYVLWIIDALGAIDEKGKPRKLEGQNFTFSTRAVKDKLEITDEHLVPDSFARIHFSVPAAAYARVAKVLEALDVLPAKAERIVDFEAVRKYLEGPAAPCVLCDGTGGVNALTEEARDIEVACPDCGGTGAVLPSLPGANMLRNRRVLVLK